MGYSRADKAQSHERIVQTAALRFREKGIDGISVADLMKDAGLTHGGFYRHFESRDDLVTQAVACAFKSGDDAIETGLSKGSDTNLASYIALYLSEYHRDHPATGCGMAALSGDVGRSGPAARELYAQHVAKMAERLGALLPAKLSAEERRANALVIVTSMAGAVSVARATGDPQLSGEILKTMCARLVRDFMDEGDGKEAVPHVCGQAPFGD